MDYWKLEIENKTKQIFNKINSIKKILMKSINKLIIITKN
jgi:hypothetical protein